MWQWTKYTMALGLTIFMAGAAQAAPLNLTLPEFPDIFSGFIDVTYQAGTQAFQASGFALTLDDDGIGGQENINNGLFNLSATINNTGVLQNGLLTIGGTVPGFNSGTLLTGLLTAFGFQPTGGDPLEFLFAVTGGDLAGLYGGIGATGGVILSETGFGGSFGMNFDNTGGNPGWGAGVSDTGAGPIPEPSTILLFTTGLGIIVSRAILHRRSKASS
jgi:hypothetical protein